jgi:hypothetical protein
VMKACARDAKLCLAVISNLGSFNGRPHQLTSHPSNTAT